MTDTSKNVYVKILELPLRVSYNRKDIPTLRDKNDDAVAVIPPGTAKNNSLHAARFARLAHAANFHKPLIKAIERIVEIAGDDSIEALWLALELAINAAYKLAQEAAK